MYDEIVINVESLNKKFKLYNSPVDRLKESLDPLRRQFHRDFYALNNVSFQIRKGESVGIIGKNGSGKSTLLKILSGVLTPTSGNVIVKGKISALLELGAGFDPELSGIDNVYFSGMLMGYPREVMNEKLDSILSFADIGEFIQQPVKTYSSGMFVRLAFAVSVNVNPEILIVDEALSVGDMQFQQKCIRKMEEFKDKSVTILYVSHDITSIKSMCSKALYMSDGSLLTYGNVKDVSDLYIAECLKENHSYEDNDILTGANITSNKLKILSAEILNDKSRFVISEDNVSISFKVKFNCDVDSPIYGFHIRNRHGVTIFETSSYCMGINNPSVKVNDVVNIQFNFICNLLPGDYSVSFGCTNRGFGRDQFEEVIVFIHDVILMKVGSNDKAIIYGGYTNLFPEMNIS